MRVADPNGAVTEMTYDRIGRLEASIVKGMPGCDASKDSLCTVDLTTTRTYSFGVGPLLAEQTPVGRFTVDSYDERGGVKTTSRGPSAIDLRGHRRPPRVHHSKSTRSEKS